MKESENSVGTKAMAAIETPRLLIQPLTQEQLRLYLANDGSLEKQLGLPYFQKDLQEEVADALENFFLPQIKDHPDSFHFYTLWTIILKDQLLLVGDLCFKGPPDEEGMIEIGYGTHETFQQRGIMTEAVAGLIAWCAKQPNIKTLLAETEPGNKPSEKVLERNHFQVHAQTPDSTWWKRRL